MTGMKCFVAMAFTREDTDALYDRSIARILEVAGIAAIRVDRVEHNDNIDDRITIEIEAADFAIADLTYARPSVYYEAGYAERSIPVIYTIRRDHLAPRADDEFGNLRLHFDLAMRNVIDWSAPDDPIFQSRLKDRIATVTRPMQAERDVQHQRSKKVAAFQALSVIGKLMAVQERLAKMIAAEGFKSGEEIGRAKNTLTRAKEDDSEMDFFRIKKGVYKFFNIEVHTDLTEPPEIEHRTFPQYDLNLKGSLDKIKTIEESWIIIAFHQIPFEHLAHEAPSFEAVPSKNMLTGTDSVKVPKSLGDFDREIFSYGEKVARDIVGGLWSGSEFEVGFLARSAPPNSVSQHHSGFFRFVYSGVKWRWVERTTKVHLIDNVQTCEDAEERLSAILRDECGPRLASPKRRGT